MDEERTLFEFQCDIVEDDVTVGLDLLTRTTTFNCSSCGKRVYAPMIPVDNICWRCVKKDQSNKESV